MAEGTRQGRHCHSLKSPEHGRKGGYFEIPETPPQPRVRSLRPSAISNSTAKAMKTFGSASWDGGVKDGRRRISTKSGALSGYPYGFGSPHRSSACRVLYHGAIAGLRPGAAHSGAHGYNGRGVSRPAGRRLCVMGEKRGCMVAFSSRQLVIKPPLRKALCQECVELRLGVP